VELFSRVLQNCALKSFIRLPLFIFEDKNNQIYRYSFLITDILTVYSLCLNPCNNNTVHRQGTSEQLFEWMWHHGRYSSNQEGAYDANKALQGED